jgi:serine/threonine-protein kinase HipA
MLPIYYEDRQLGHIERESSGLAFAYAPAWLEWSHTFPISLSMPPRKEPYPAPVATPWFANLLPEERQLERIGRLLGHDQGDVYGLLEEIGRDTAGALSIGRPQPVPHGSHKKLTGAELAHAIDRLPERPLLAGEAGVTMSLAGAQSKLPVAMFDGEIYLPLNGAASTHILKPASDRLYATVENELLCMRLAAAVGIAVAPAAMGSAMERRYLLVERYDRSILPPRTATRSHQEDFCQILGIYPTQKYEASGGPGLTDLFRVIDAHIARSARDRLALLDLVVFACCIGDTDRHAKNYSVLLSGGSPRLAPGYDLMTSLAYDGITRNIAMKIGGKKRAEYLERRHWERFARENRLAPAATVRRVEQLARLAGTKVDSVAAELAQHPSADREAIKLFSGRIRDRANTVAANARRGPADEGKASDEDDDISDFP